VFLQQTIVFAASECGCDKWADGLATAAGLALIQLKAAMNTAYNNYTGALSIYHNYAHSLPANQQTKNTLWKKKLGTQSSKIAQDLLKKTQTTEKASKQAEKKEKREADNVEKILKTITKIASPQQAAAKTSSFLT
jgi:hypothetical protein